VGGGNTATGSTGAVQSSQLGTTPTSTAGGTTTTVPVTAGNGGAGNTSTNSTGTIQLGGNGGTTPAGNPPAEPGTTVTGGTERTPASAATPAPASSVEKQGAAPTAGHRPTPFRTSHAAGTNVTRTSTPRVASTPASPLLRLSHTLGTLPFTGLRLLAWLIAALAALLLGTAVREISWSRI
jgi:hypothetical protein